MKNKLGKLLIRWGVALTKGGETMLAIYVALIHKGIITIEAVPASSRNKVADALEAAGMDQKGNIV